MEKFILFNSFNEDLIIQNVIKLEKEFNDDLYNLTLSNLLNHSYNLNLGGDIFKSYICYLLSNDENPITLLAEKDLKDIDKSLYNIAIKDISKVIKLFNLDMGFPKFDKKDSYIEIQNILLSKNENNILDSLLSYYNKNGAGIMNKYKAFKWSEKTGLIGIENCDPITFETLVGYERQKGIIMKNTEDFLNGYDANNVLLFGDSGTGKSSSVKALLNKYHDKGLRLIELNKSDFMDLNNILSYIRNRGLKFILFLDDLSFEEFESEYKHMKALIEGGVEIRPKNVLIYATSNRRHLIRETWNDRQGDDIHVSDTRQEKYSLSERFGITLTFTSSTQEEYINIVKGLVKEKGIDIDENILREKAIQWSMVSSGFNGRVAKQFVSSLN